MRSRQARTRGGPGWRRFAGVAVVATLVTAGCGDDGGESSGSGDSIRLAIAEQQIADFAPIWLGVSEGIFAGAGIEVEIVSGAASSSGQIPLVLSGQADLAATTATSAVQADAENIPVRIVGGLTTFGETAEEDQGGLITTAEAPYESYPDLNGTVVVVSGLQSVTHAMVQAAIEQAGGDLSTINFIQAPMPNIANLVATGGADAGFVVDPFLAAGLADGMSLLGRPAHEVAAGFPATSIIASSSYVEGNQETLERFSEALAEAAQYAADHPDAVVAAVAEGVGIPAEQLAGSTHPVFEATVDVDLMEAEAALLSQYGAVAGEVDVASIVWAPSADE